MTTFEERRDQFEKKYLHEEELLFKAKARRNKLFGLAIANRIGKAGEDAEIYARSVVVAALTPAGDDGILQKVSSDLEAAGKSVPEQELRQILSTLMVRATDEIKNQ